MSAVNANKFGYFLVKLTYGKMALDPYYLPEADLNYECRLRNFAVNLATEMKIQFISNMWKYEEAISKRPMDQPEYLTFAQEIPEIERRIQGILRPMMRGGSMNKNRVWTRLYQASWTLFRFRNTAVYGEHRAKYLEFENQLVSIYDKMRSRIDYQCTTFGRAYRWVHDARRKRLGVTRKEAKAIKEPEFLNSGPRTPEGTPPTSPKMEIAEDDVPILHAEENIDELSGMEIDRPNRSPARQPSQKEREQVIETAKRCRRRSRSRAVKRLQQQRVPLQESCREKSPAKKKAEVDYKPATEWAEIHQKRRQQAACDKVAELKPAIVFRPRTKPTSTVTSTNTRTATIVVAKPSASVNVNWDTRVLRTPTPESRPSTSRISVRSKERKPFPKDRENRPKCNRRLDYVQSNQRHEPEKDKSLSSPKPGPSKPFVAEPRTEKPPPSSEDESDFPWTRIQRERKIAAWRAELPVEREKVRRETSSESDDGDFLEKLAKDKEKRLAKRRVVDTTSVHPPIIQWSPRTKNRPAGRAPDNVKPACYRHGERWATAYQQELIAQSCAIQWSQQGTPEQRQAAIDQLWTIDNIRRVQAMLDRRAQSPVNYAEMEPYDSVWPTKPPLVALPEDDEKDAESYDAECIVCRDRKVNTIFWPCGHFMYCWTCAEDSRRENRVCDYCKQPVTNRKKAIGPNNKKVVEDREQQPQ